MIKYQSRLRILCLLTICVGATVWLTSNGATLHARPVFAAAPSAPTPNDEEGEPESQASASDVLAVEDADESSEATTGGMSRVDALLAALTIFVVSVFLGFELINKVPATLHTPLMSGSNAISGITLVGAILMAGNGTSVFAALLGFVAVALAMINVIGGFLVTDRMLSMFQRR